MESKCFASVFKIGRDEWIDGIEYWLCASTSAATTTAQCTPISQGGGFRYVDCVLVHDADGNVRIAITWSSKWA